MDHYYEYNLYSTTRIEEEGIIADGGLLQLRHIPKYRSVVVENFEETDSLSLTLNQFRVSYSLDTYQRESNRMLFFNPAHDGLKIKVSYITCGTVILASELNEIKAHLESDHTKFYTLPTASAEQKGGIRCGEGLHMTGDILNVDFNYLLARLKAELNG